MVSLFAGSCSVTDLRDGYHGLCCHTSASRPQHAEIRLVRALPCNQCGENDRDTTSAVHQRSAVELKETEWSPTMVPSTVVSGAKLSGKPKCIKLVGRKEKRSHKVTQVKSVTFRYPEEASSPCETAIGKRWVDLIQCSALFMVLVVLCRTFYSKLCQHMFSAHEVEVIDEHFESTQSMARLTQPEYETRSHANVCRTDFVMYNDIQSFTVLQALQGQDLMDLSELPTSQYHGAKSTKSTLSP